MDWLTIAQRLPVTYNRPQMGMATPILGAVLHTTNHSAGAETLERFQHDWQAGQNQSAHFIVDRAGGIGQLGSLTEVAWHAGTLLGSTRYVGIEHIAKPRQQLTDDQTEASSKLLAVLSQTLGFPLKGLTKPVEPGVGIHNQFVRTGCGDNVFKAPDGSFAQTFSDILGRAWVLSQGPIFQGPPPAP